MRPNLFRAMGLLLALAFGSISAPALAAGESCKSMQDLCAARCKVRVPDDKNCVSDHCTPKLNQCRKDGCWQEGNLYGGKKTCGLAKS